ncbi:hypothetical protein ALI144C_19080 [Actinosynnema sp. ALI-1.44]|uniref:AfsR/SARP family transcriptional regulator n=1 Tax=Actinosynnema sp. ALI-1.44 TaxID=1933779 RepID=UPI00097BDB26|nr:AfsR/SARP family transcriptional regulator [Actinosynnema sp. ALI-1.44]ONI81441.1 hypothetical protein ALI144C_19080 [Actinosynnema sp. ALI-1.44]
MTVEFRVLGDVEVHIDEHLVNAGHSRQLCVLLALLVDANRTVSTNQILDRVWGDRPPHRARGTVATYLNRLRQVLADGGEEVHIARRSGGYALAVEPNVVDLHRFRHLTGQAQRVDDDRAVTLLERALGLWRGKAFAHLDTPWLADIRETLDRERFAALLDRNDLCLRRGEHARLLPELVAHAAEHPLDERLAGQLVLALHRTGRRSEALRAFQETKRLLSEKLGIDPGPDLRRLHDRILSGDFDHAAASTRRSGNVLRRNDLPGDVVDFTGRVDEVTRLLACPPTAADGLAPQAVAVTAIDGMAGIGKTALAVHIAHKLAQRYPDGQLFIDLHGHTTDETAVDPMTALDVLLRAAGVPGERIPDSLDARAALWRAELANREVLVVLDNAASASQVRPLLPGSPHCRVLITSRHRLVDLDTGHVLSLDVLPAREAVALFTRILGEHRAVNEPEAVREVVRLCGYLPLAVRIAAARLCTRPAWTVRHLVDRLGDRHQRLAELDTGDRGAAAAFTLSYRRITSDQQRVFRLLGLHPGSDFDAHAAACLTGATVDVAEKLVEGLVDAHLLQQPQPGRYGFHDLLRHYARQTASATDEDRHTALARLVGHYSQLAVAADRLLDPRRPRVHIGEPIADCHPRPFGDQAAALRWLDTEHHNLLACQRLAVEENWHGVVWQLAWTLDTYQRHRGHLPDRLVAWQAALTAAVRLDESTLVARSHLHVGAALARLGRHGDALDHLDQARQLAGATGDLACTWDQALDIHQAWHHPADADQAPYKIDSAGHDALETVRLPVQGATGVPRRTRLPAKRTHT